MILTAAKPAELHNPHEPPLLIKPGIIELQGRTPRHHERNKYYDECFPSHDEVVGSSLPTAVLSGGSRNLVENLSARSKAAHRVAVLVQIREENISGSPTIRREYRWAL